MLNISRKFTVDTFWNVVALVFLGISGISINLLVVRFYDTTTLGFFNQIYALYMITSQIAVGSVHLSIQKHIPQFLERKKELDRLISVGLVLTIVFAILTAVLMYFLRNIWVDLYRNSDFPQGVILILPGLVGFAINKSLLAVLNGFRKMKHYALFQALRYLLLVIFIVVAIILKVKGGLLPATFSLTEITLLLILFPTSLKLFSLHGLFNWNGWLKKHFSFSYKSLFGHILSDLNNRVDILILGYFVSASQVGIYSFAAVLAEGFFQILVVLKTNVNPILARLASQGKMIELKSLIKKGIRYTYLGTLVLGSVVVLIYPLLVEVFAPGSGLLEAWPVFIVLIFGIFLASGYQPFQLLLAQVGYPSLYTLLISTVFVVNVFLNLVLIPRMGIMGSALATGLAFILSALLLKILTRKAVKISI